ncbi:HPr family phosphocarrier protein [Peribacillus sp. SCS-155]
MVQQSIKIHSKDGIHAGSGTKLVQTAGKFSSEIMLAYEGRA